LACHPQPIACSRSSLTRSRYASQAAHPVSPGLPWSESPPPPFPY
jgi:hypothetical protein